MATSTEGVMADSARRPATWAPGHDNDDDTSPLSMPKEEVDQADQTPAHVNIVTSFDDSTLPPYKTNSFWGSWKPDEQAQPPAEVAAELITKAQDFEKQSAELTAAAQNLHDMAKMQAYAEACALGQMPAGYNAFMPPVMLMPWQQAGAMPMMPPAAAAAAGVAGASAMETGGGAGIGKTTVMWRNIPNNYTRDELLELMKSEGFEGSYDFFYSPIDFTSNALVGYAFINFISTEEADRFYYRFQQFTQWSLKSEKVSEVAWSHPLQGLAGHIERYRNSPVMHPDVSDDKKPVLLKNGKRIPFPEPTKKIRAPHLKECRPRAD